MKAIAITAAGPPETLQIVKLPDSVPAANEVVVRQTFAGINYGDTIRRKRGLFKLNDLGYFVPGFEGTGSVISVGVGVKKFKIGDRVAYLNEMGGGYAQKIAVSENFLFKVPDEIPDETAAGMTCAGATAWHLINLSKIKKGSWVLIHGATGGVGLILIQLAILKGANIIAIVGTTKKKDFLKNYKVKSVLVNGLGDVRGQIRQITGGYGINAIFDCVGKAVMEINLHCIRKGGVILYYGSTSGHPEFSGLEILRNSLRIHGFNIFNLLVDFEKWQKGLDGLFSAIVKNKIEIHIHKVFKMTEAASAHQLLESRNSIGKLLFDLS